mmetsp:Transcript_1683/g.4639  ORF Transcript_1683/g.4639 Transcript_1683/m.4639 type:complete len:97 (-) Transcript_1683:133-423(-)
MAAPTQWAGPLEMGQGGGLVTTHASASQPYGRGDEQHIVIQPPAPPPPFGHGVSTQPPPPPLQQQGSGEAAAQPRRESVVVSGSRPSPEATAADRT